MIHKARNTDGKDNSIIYGVATDGFEYRFWRIENNSNVGDIYHYYLKMLREGVDSFKWHL